MKTDKAPKNNKKIANSQLKTYIDFTEIFEKRTINWKGLFIGILVIAICSSLFGKFAVYDLMRSVDHKRAEVTERQELLNNYNATIKAEKKIPSLYHHYTWNFMTDEEKENILRAKAMKVVELFGDKDFELSGYSVKGNNLTLSITTDSMDKLVSIIEELKEIEYIDAVSVDNVLRNKGTDSENAGEIVDVQMRITMIKEK